GAPGRAQDPQRSGGNGPRAPPPAGGSPGSRWRGWCRRRRARAARRGRAPRRSTRRSTPRRRATCEGRPPRGRPDTNGARALLYQTASMLDVVRLGGRTARRGGGLAPPLPARDLRHVVAVLADVQLVFDELVAARLLRVRRPRAELRQAIDHIGHQVEAIELVPHRHVERYRGRPFLLVAGSDFTEAEVSTSAREHRGVR